MRTKISKKISLIGHFGVGKTSLVKQFVFSKFSDEYLTTIGVNIDKKIVMVGDTEVTMIIWDIAGEVSLSKIPPPYMLGSHGVIFVFDLTREDTWSNIKEQIALFKQKLPNVELKIVGNKSDMLSEKELKKTLSSLPVKCDYVSSAKTGVNVEELFNDIAKSLS